MPPDSPGPGVSPNPPALAASRVFKIICWVGGTRLTYAEAKQRALAVMYAAEQRRRDSAIREAEIDAQLSNCEFCGGGTR